MTLFLEFRLIDAHKRLNLLQEQASAQGRGDVAREIMECIDREHLDYVNRMGYHADKYQKMLQEGKRVQEKVKGEGGVRI